MKPIGHEIPESSPGVSSRASGAYFDMPVDIYRIEMELIVLGMLARRWHLQHLPVSVHAGEIFATGIVDGDRCRRGRHDAFRWHASNTSSPKLSAAFRRRDA